TGRRRSFSSGSDCWTAIPGRWKRWAGNSALPASGSGRSNRRRCRSSGILPGRRSFGTIWNSGPRVSGRPSRGGLRLSGRVLPVSHVRAERVLGVVGSLLRPLPLVLLHPVANPFGWVALLVEPLPHRRARLLHAVLDRVQALASAGARGVLH